MITACCCPTRGGEEFPFLTPSEFPDQQMKGSVVSKPESVNRKAEVRTHQAQSRLLDVGTRTCHDLQLSLGNVNTDWNTCSRVVISRQRKTITYQVG